MRKRSVRLLTMAGFLALGSPAIVVASIAQDLQFEQVGDIPINAHDIDFDSEGTLWGSSAGTDFWRLDPATHLWDGPGNRGGNFFSALSPDTLLIATFSGVHRSLDGGETWQVKHFQGGAFFEGDPQGANYGVILVGENTGGSGIAYSTDRGATFTESVFTVVPGSRPTMETAVEIPDGPAAGRLVAGVFAGVVISEDGGQTWSPSSLFQSARYLAERLAIGAHHITGERMLYASVIDTQATDAQLFVSSDDGLTWTSASTLPDPFLLAVSPTTPVGNGHLFGITIGDGAIFRSTDSGQTWTSVGMLPIEFSGTIVRDALIGPDGRLYASVTEAGSDREWVYRTFEPVVVSNEPPPNVPEEDLILRVYPNPATDLITIETDAEEVEILDVLGRIVMTANPNEQIDTSRLPVGVYVLRAGSQSQRFTVVR